jgi:hypothetical protein
MELSKQLEANFAMLQEGWPECKMHSICGSDLYYTDGLAQEAVFKIEFKQKSLYITTVYIMKDGDWFSSDYKTNILVKKAVNDWIEGIKSNTSVCK